MLTLSPTPVFINEIESSSFPKNMSPVYKSQILYASNQLGEKAPSCLMHHLNYPECEDIFKFKGKGKNVYFESQSLINACTFAVRRGGAFRRSLQNFSAGAAEAAAAAAAVATVVVVAAVE